MESPVRKSVVVSAVNLRKGGTLTVLRDCLSYLSTRKDLDVTAIVHSERLCHFDGIRYIEIPWSAKSWIRRLWCEYVTLHRISGQMPETDLWLSLHDTTPRVRANRQAVYCHTSFPFLETRARDWRMNPKIPLFSKFTKYAYRMFVHRNAFLVAQQNWFREGLSRITGFPSERIIVAPPRFEADQRPDNQMDLSEPPMFFYPASPDCHKNFETLCEAARLLEARIGTGRFTVRLTLSGDENRYARWIKRKWGSVASLSFAGFLTREDLFAHYAQAHCLVFPSRVETWGLPISEYMPTGKPMLLADLPYAHETASGSMKTAFFPPNDPEELADQMHRILENEYDFLSQVPGQETKPPRAENWDRLFEILLMHENTSTR